MSNFYYPPAPGLSKNSPSPFFPGLNQMVAPAFSGDQGLFQQNSLEKLNQFLSDPNMRQLLKDIINHTNGVNIMAPILTLQINTLNGGQLELNHQGITEIFSKFGKVLNILMKTENKAFVVFCDMSQALFAQKSLNSQYLPDIQANIRVEFITQAEYEELFSPKKEDLQKKLIVQNERPEKKGLDKSLEKEEAIEGSGAFKFQTSIPVKFTCRYEIQIENDKDFQVARKIIGSKVLLYY